MPMSQSFRKRLYPNLPKIIERFGTPFHIYDEAGIVATVGRMQAAFTAVGLDFREFYAVKALPREPILQTLASAGCGFDCSSIHELQLARMVGARSGDIMFTSNNTSSAEFHEAVRGNGCILNLDDITLIDRVPKPFPETICFRLNPGDLKPTGETNSIIGDPKKSKYGVPYEHILEAYRRAKKRGARRFGLHTMVCSNDLNKKHMLHTVQMLLDTASQLTRADFRIEFVNAGGGIGIPYRPMDKEFDLESFASQAGELFDLYNRQHGYSPRFFLECGRYVTGPHGVLVNQVINTYRKYEDFIGVEVAMPALMRVGMYASAYHHCEVLTANGRLKTGPTRPQSVVGPICENCDRLLNKGPLPTARIGDLVVTHDTGAHGAAMGFQYNGRPRPQELLVGRDGVVSRIIRAETLDDLYGRHNAARDYLKL